VRPVVTAAEVKALDRATIDELGIPSLTLMETAGRGVAEVARAMAPDGCIAVICGPGNNGGDGFVIARVLRAWGLDAIAYLAVARRSVTGEAAAHLAILECAGGVVRMISTPAELAAIGDAIPTADLAIDALFGVGLARPIEGHLAEVVAQTNRCKQRLAVDIPSGLDADTGRMLGACVDAQRTVSMAALKVALVSAPGFARCGEVSVVEIGIPASMIAASARAGLVEEADIACWLPRSRQLDHKGDRGHVLVIAGSPGFRGAGRLAATAAARVGAGLVTLASEGETTAPDSIMTHALAGSAAKLIANKAAVVIGCGLGHGDAARGWVAEVLAAGVPAVLDADALNLCVGRLDAIAAAAGPVVLTPHPGEASRLLGITIAEIEADRLAAARLLAHRVRAVIVLKGARTIVCDGTLGDDHCSINPTGGPELATGGSGDVLAGIIGGLLAQKLSAIDAARTGVYLHGLAGDVAGKQAGRGLMSSDLLPVLPSILGMIPRLA
jgi:ADP-dependent NAD(P)H-hydrate dehydratase / NAD(P)H-hydrate epimerase